MTKAGDMRRVVVALRPVDGGVLSLGRVEYVVCMILHNIIRNRCAFLPTFRASLDDNVAGLGFNTKRDTKPFKSREN